MDSDSKKQLRKSLKEVVIPDREAKEARIFETAAVLIAPFTNIYIFNSIGNEPNTKPIIDHCFANDKRVFLPVVKGKEMFFVEVNSKTEYLKGAFGIQEPRYVVETRKSENEIPSPDIVFVPLCAYTKTFERLGKGGGFYDRFLPTVTCSKIGLSFAEFEVPSVYAEPHDVKLDGVLKQ
ncbi:MAG: 5-formyltetrahydrofolate cyclo-ligase [Christensenellaceae bacterium]|nr:5-formyltetrahydrofolate cyclo-ligase [Christensenellaceae bacterium]